MQACCLQACSLPAVVEVQLHYSEWDSMGVLANRNINGSWKHNGAVLCPIAAPVGCGADAVDGILDEKQHDDVDDDAEHGCSCRKAAADMH